MSSNSPSHTNHRVSVVIPCYNHARFLGEAIQTVLNQTYRDFEIIVVDDGSTDNTPQVVASFGDAVRCVRQENRGLAAARNAGVLAAKGAFVGLLDADDSWLPAYLARMVQAFGDDAMIGAVYCGWHYIDSVGRMLPRINIGVFPREKMYRIMTFMDFLIPSSVIVRRECFDQLGLFDESFRTAQGCEDWDMWIRILTKYQMVGVPQALVKYRIHSDNMSSNLEQMERAKQVVVVKHFGAEEKKSVAHRRAYGGLYLSSALAYFEHGQIEKGQQFLQRAFAVYPELASDVDTFYQLAVTNQPVGYRGVFESLDLEISAQKLLDNLNAIFASPSLFAELKPRRSQAYGNAYLALGLLAYGCRYLAQARNYLLRAIRVYPLLLSHAQVIPTLIKLYLGVRVTRVLKHWRNRPANSAEV